MRALVTGATGFIGFNLVKRLREEKWEVLCLVRPTSSREKMEKLIETGARLYPGDLSERKSLENLPTNIDVVYHLAALLDHSVREYEPFYRINVLGTQNLVERYLNSGIRSFIFVSSIAAIGLVETGSGLLKEEVKCNPVTFYGKSKEEAEKLLLSYSREFNFPVTILRPPTVYGPGSRLSEMIEFVYRKVVNRRPIFYADRGSALTSLCWVGNLVDALVLAAKRRCTGELFHVDDGRPYTHREIVWTICSALHRKPIEIFVPSTVLYPLAFFNEAVGKLGVNISGLSREKVRMLSTSLALDSRKAQEHLGYKPVSKLGEYVREFVQTYFRISS
ncbi:MAG: NAD-dependent epimerase/dehydratase family protein [Candidatus Hadarchaeales archaeon]